MKKGRQSEAALLWGLDQRHLAIELPYFDIVTISKSNGPQHGLFIVLGDYHLGRKDVGLVVEKERSILHRPAPHGLGQQGTQTLAKPCCSRAHSARPLLKSASSDAPVTPGAWWLQQRTNSPGLVLVVFANPTDAETNQTVHKDAASSFRV